MENKTARVLLIFAAILLIANSAMIIHLYLLISKIKTGFSESKIVAPIGLQTWKEEDENNQVKIQKQENNVCPESCLKVIKQATSSYQLKSKPAPAPTTFIIKQDSTASTANVFYIPLGSAQTASPNAWQDTGAQAWFDLSDYSNVKAVYFEASLSVPAGRVTVRLYNATDNVDEVWNSELWTENSTPTLVSSSQPIRIWEGKKLYKVQIKTSLDFEGTIDSARLKIVTE